MKRIILQQQLCCWEAVGCPVRIQPKPNETRYGKVLKIIKKIGQKNIPSRHYITQSAVTARQWIAPSSSYGSYRHHSAVAPTGSSSTLVLQTGAIKRCMVLPKPTVILTHRRPRFLSSDLNPQQWQIVERKHLAVYKKLNVINEVVNLKYGLGLEIHKLPLWDQYQLSQNPSYIFRDSVVFSKINWRPIMWPIPVMINISPFRNKRQVKSFSVGMSAGYLYNSRNKQISDERGSNKSCMAASISILALCLCWRGWPRTGKTVTAVTASTRRTYGVKHTLHNRVKIQQLVESIKNFSRLCCIKEGDHLSIGPPFMQYF